MITHLFVSLYYFKNRNWHRSDTSTRDYWIRNFMQKIGYEEGYNTAPVFEIKDSTN